MDNTENSSDSANPKENMLSGSSDSANPKENTLSGSSDSANPEENTLSGSSDSANPEENTLSGSSDSANPKEKPISEHVDANKRSRGSAKMAARCPKIAKIDTNNLRNDEHFQFHTEFLNLILKETALKLKIPNQLQAHLVLYGREDEALFLIKKSLLTGKIVQSNKAREKTFSGMAKTAKAALNHHSPQLRQAALRLKILLDTYGNIAKKRQFAQTASAYNLLQELRGRYAQDAEAVGISAWADELEARNNAFSGLIRERFDEAASKTPIVLRAARAELDRSFALICELINAFAVTEGAAEYEGFIKRLNIVIASYAAALNARSGRRRTRAAATPKPAPEP